MSRQPSPVKLNPLVMPMVLANVGVLVALFFSPNGDHALLPAALGGGALALIGFALMLRAIVARRRQEEAAERRR